MRIFDAGTARDFFCCGPTLHHGFNSGMISLGTTILLVLALLALASFESLWPVLVACIAAVVFLLLAYPLWIGIKTQVRKRKESTAQALKKSAAQNMENILKTSLQNNPLDSEAYQKLLEQASLLGLAKTDLDELRRKFFQQEAAHFLETANSTGLVSDEQYEQLVRLAEDHGVELRMDARIVAANINWRSANLREWEPRAIFSDLLESQDEQTYFHCPAQWARQVVESKGKGYLNTSMRFRVASGISVGVDRSYPVFEEYDSLKTLGEGTLYFTSKKLFFKSAEESHTILLNRISDVDLYADGVRIYKAKGRPEVFIMEEWAAGCVNELMKKVFERNRMSGS